MTIKLKNQDMLSQLLIDDSGEAKFCLLIGAGASFSSGIPTARQLVDQWKDDLRKIESKDNPALEGCTIYDKEFNDFYNNWKLSKVGELINPSDYSVLMEHFRPTPALRQALIEEKVNGKYPGFGYLYLSMLIDAGYFNVIFTTNFDDLMNDALYRFIDSRPLVCSFDSNISSIRITSKRPKIIKLHGDYLFNNIKNTVSEVRNLTNNMEDKFRQLCQEYGLIVIGYSGGDDSVMDIIKAMLKDTEYLKMGLHWCIRKGDPIPRALESSAGLSDRLHFYEVESFDILMGDMCSNAEVPLPIEVTDPTKSNTITKLINVARSLTKANLSPKILDDAYSIIHSLQNKDVGNDIFIAKLHLQGKMIQESRGRISSAETINSVEGLVENCRILLGGSANSGIGSTGCILNTAERVDVYLIMGVAKISHAKVTTNDEDKAKLYSEIINMLNEVTDQANALITSVVSNHRTIFCRLHFNIACIYGLLASIDNADLSKFCKQAIGHLVKLRGFDEGLPYLERIMRNEEDDLLVFEGCPDFKNFYE